jgi:tetratricopeptide (TPR) repeat protein
MRNRFYALLIGTIFAATGAPALAQDSPKSEPAKPEEHSGAQAEPRRSSAQNLDRLFQALKVAPDTDSAKYIENRIWAAWLWSDSDTVNLLMSRVKTALEARDFDLAVRLLNSIVDFKPDYAEAWHRRAMIFYMRKEFDRSLADLREVLAREPRHFGALASLGAMMQEFGDEKHALDAFRRALEVYPRLERVPGVVRNIPEIVKRLGEKVDGRDI